MSYFVDFELVMDKKWMSRKKRRKVPTIFDTNKLFDKNFCLSQ